MRKQRTPRRASGAIAALADRVAPASGLGALQRVWRDVAGDLVAAQAFPSAEREGVVIVTCSSSVWAQELTLMAPDLAARLNAALGAEIVRELRCRAAPAGSWAKAPLP